MSTDFIPGADLPETFAAVDAALDPAQIKTTATRIIETYHRLVTDPANHAETAECVPLRLIRAALATEPREYLDAALRWLDTQPSGQPDCEITYMGKPTPADMAAAVFVAAGEHHMANLLWFDAPATGRNSTPTRQETFMAATRCPPSQADWYAHAVITRDLPDEGTATDEIDDYFTGDEPTPRDLPPLPEGWQILEFTAQPTPRQSS